MKSLRFLFKFFVIALLLVSSFAAGYLFATGRILATPLLAPFKVVNRDSPKDALDFAPFWKALDLLEQKYYDPSKLNSQSILFGAIRGMVASLSDPYTAFFDPSQNQEFKDELSGVYEGIGAQLGFRDSQLVVIAPLFGSPAEKAGVRPLDQILKIDGKETVGMPLPEAVSLIRGKAGSKVKLALGRETETREVEIERAKIKVESVTLEWKGKNSQIAYIKLSRFGDDTQAEWNRVVGGINDKFPASTAGGQISNLKSQGVILDVRNNPGGLLETAAEVAAEFFEDGKTVIREENNGQKIPLLVKKPGRLTKAPLTVLINEGAASASEIVAGAISDRGRGKLVGQKSFGKGTIQEAVELDGGASLHITTSKWLLPSGRWINGTGLTPDVVVELKEEDIKAGRDPQLEKAIEILESQN